MTLLLGYGFLGKTLAAHLRNEGLDFRVGSRHLYAPEETFHVYFDLNAIQSYEQAFRDADTVVHLMHPTVPLTSGYHPDIDLVYNIRANEQLLNYLGAHSSVRRILYVSTGGALYGPTDAELADESHACRPVSNYGKGKLLLEALYFEQCASLGIELQIIRPSNVYGPLQSADKPQGVIAHILQAIRQDTPFTLWGDGATKKDYLYAADFARAISLMLNNPNPQHSIYNLSSGQTYSIRELIATIENISGKRVQIRNAEAPSFDVRKVALDHSRFSRDFGWQPEYSLEEGLKAILQNFAKP